MSRSGRLEIRALDGRLIGARRFRGLLMRLSWSRDGRRLAAAWFDHRLRDHIALLGRRGRVLRTVAVPGDVSFSPAAWAPDGRSLVYAARPDDRDRPAQIRRLDVATGAQTVLLRGTRCGPAPLGVCELLDSPVIAPDGLRVALVRDLNAVTVLAPGALPQPRRRDAVRHPATVADLGHMDVAGLTISPDGTRAAFAGSDDIDF